MMHSRVLQCWLMLPLLMAIASACALPNPQTPEQSFDLYARFLLEGDVQAAEQASALTGVPLRTEPWEVAVERMLVGDTPAENARTQLGRALSPKVVEALRQTRCRSTGSARDDREGVQIAIVAYTCQMPDYATVTDRVPAHELAGQVAQDDLVLIRVWIDLLQRAPKRPYGGQVTMARQNEGDAWAPQDLPPLHEWIQMLLTLPE